MTSKRTPAKRPNARRRRPAERAPKSGGTPARREEVLEAALALISDHGVAGASLRMLAARLGMSQPSLYHYFPSKDALVREIIDYSTGRMLGAGASIPFPETAAELPRFVRDAVLGLYATESHPRFIRFLFLVAMGNPEYRALVERYFAERLWPSFGLLAERYARNERERDELEAVAKMIVYSLGFMLLEERALLGKPEPRPTTVRYSEQVLEAANELLRARGFAGT